MSTILIRTAVAGLALAGLASCAPSTASGSGPGYSEAGGRPCFSPSQVHNFVGPDTGPIYVRARVSEVFELTTPGCPGFSFSNSLNLRPDGPSDQLCIGDRARIMPTGQGTAGVVCVVQVARKLTPGEVAALPDRLQP